eukprot:CAMPEP_0202369310 /NCGR_PEP_ID=MMETSP1127-20130417/1172_1 /ASSEMBLY_ACC=CAM_ASM_000462 /TAXON_ID=3047 /ORGANISM="Dunaliella tertiolecta, Strain CCMP1320" /LENGTH=259 /DNA_ID=CAMNT_0048964931 /DNA_START=62 /DNA_END=841 /DNA_ORIENTATION=-
MQASLSPFKRLAPACSQALASFSSSSAPGFVEVREYVLKPEGVTDYLRLTEEYADVRKELLPFLGMFSCDIGALNKVTHFYSYKDYDERDQVRARVAQDARWKRYVNEGRKHVVHQTSKIMMEALPIYQALNLPSTTHFQTPPRLSDAAPKVMYEMRNYQLHPGYGSVPKLIDAFAKGLPAKLEADPGNGNLAFFGYVDVGTLNNVVELWRYESAQACIRARQASRTVPAWRETIGAVTPGVQHFTSEFLRPLPLSKWQ